MSQGFLGVRESRDVEEMHFNLLYLMVDCRLAEEGASYFSSWGKSLASWEHLQGGCSASVSKIQHFP